MHRESATNRKPMIFRLTQRLSSKIKTGSLATLPLDENPWGDWSARLFTADRAQYIMVTDRGEDQSGEGRRCSVRRGIQAQPNSDNGNRDSGAKRLCDTARGALTADDVMLATVIPFK